MFGLLFLAVMVAGMFSLALGATAGWIALAVLVIASLAVRIAKPKWFW